MDEVDEVDIVDEVDVTFFHIALPFVALYFCEQDWLKGDRL